MPEFIVDGLGSFEGGVNSGVAPQLLERNQLAFATNASLRNGFIHNRPGNRKQTLTYTDDPAIQPLVEQALFQGATYYKPDAGGESLVASIGGRLFQFTPDTDRTVAVVDRTIPGDPNPATPQIAWLWQTENYIINMDGQSVPIFFNGTFSRRSDTTSEVLGTTSVNFVIPERGETVVITLAAPYTGENNQVFFIDGATYQATTTAATNNATLTSLFDDVGTIYPVGTNLIIDPNLYGVQTLLIDFSAFVGTFPANGVGVVLNLTQASTFPIGTKFTLLGRRWRVVNVSGPNILAYNDQSITFAPATMVQAGTRLFLTGTSFPTTIIGTLTQQMISPAIGVDIDVIVNPAFTGTPGQAVLIGDRGQYTIEALPPPPPGTSLTIININGNPGDTVTAPEELISVPELPIGRMGAYGMGRNWVALTDGFSFMAGDIVGGPSGTFANDFRDSVLKSTENEFLAGGGNFRVPSAGGQITAMTFTATLDVSLGQGPLQIFTPYQVFSVNTPVERDIWAVITNPILTVSLIGSGGVGQNSTVLTNGDVLFRSPDANIRSLILARREFSTSHGNTPVSEEMTRVIIEEVTSLLPFASAVYFNNRRLDTAIATSSALGVFHSGFMSLNFDPVSSMRGKLPSIYEGLWTGLNVLQVITGQFSGVDRSFAFCYNEFFNKIELWELLPEKTNANIFDNDTIPITWSFESASLFRDVQGKALFDPVTLMDGEIYLSDIRGAVNVEVWYRPEYSKCWIPWIEFGVCAANIEATQDPLQYRSRLGLGEPSARVCDPTNDRPYRIGRNFQFRFQITGSCTFRGALFKATKFTETLWSVPKCEPLCVAVENAARCEPCATQGICLDFPLVFYNLNAHRTYTNGAMAFDVTCSDGTVKLVQVPAGTITVVLPFPDGYTGVYPPIMLNCGGSLIVRTIPSGATQNDIDIIINAMIAQCAEATAQTLANCPVPQFLNEEVYYPFPCPEGETITFNGTLPSWITLDTVNSRLVGAAGTFTGETVALATATAQFNLNSFGDAAVTAGDLECSSGEPNPCIDGFGEIGNNVYQIQGYFAGMITPVGVSCGGVEWDGTLPFFTLAPTGQRGWYAGDGGTCIEVNGIAACNLRLSVDCEDPENPVWTLGIGDGEVANGAYVATKVGGGPTGLYTRISGSSPIPATLTIEQGVGVTGSGTYNICPS